MLKLQSIKIGVRIMLIKCAFKRLFWVISILTSLSACSTYPNKFRCGDAKGLGCTMLRDVDAQIDSGQIEEAYKDKKECRGGICKRVPFSGELLRRSSQNKATLIQERELQEESSESHVYF